MWLIQDVKVVPHDVGSDAMYVDVGINITDTLRGKAMSEVSRLLKSAGTPVNIIRAQHFDKTPLYGGAFVDPRSGELVYIKKVIYNKPAVIVLWSDDTKTTAKCDVRDKYNKELGLMFAVMKKLQSNDFVQRLLSDWVPEEKNIDYVTLTDVRKKHRKENK